MLNRRFALSSFLAAALAVANVGYGAPEVSAKDEEMGTTDGLAAGRHVFVAADGAEIPYVVSGSGKITVVLVHCWMCDRTFWDAQVPVLQGTYRVIALDLPGHGEGSQDRERWSIEGFGQDVAGLLEQLDLQKVVLVGHSMGGPVALKAAALAGGRVRGIVAVDTLHNAEFDFNHPQMKQVVDMFQADFRTTCSTMVHQMFVEKDVDEILARVLRTGCEESNAEAGKALMMDFAAIDLPKLFREAGVPIRAINAAAPNPTRIDINRKYADFDAVLMEGVGHYLHMTRPEEFNELLLKTLEQMLPPAVAVLLD
jgi:pimeloyl-ACP methyl ester carboxylesterase